MGSIPPSKTPSGDGTRRHAHEADYTDNQKEQHTAPPDAAWDPSLEPDEEDDEPRWTELQLAARYGEVQRINEILAEFTDPQQRLSAVNEKPVGYYGQTALQAACLRSHEETVRVLLAAGADLHAPGGNNVYRTAFEIACGVGNRAIVDMLLDAGAVANPQQITRYQGRTPIQAAAEGNHKDIVQLLLSLGANVNAAASASSGVTALQAAARRGHYEMVVLLLASGADVNAPAGKFKGFTALQAACLVGDTRLVDLLLREGADVDAPGSVLQGGTALHAAVAAEHIDIVKTLLAAGADPNKASGRHGSLQTPLQNAFLVGRMDLVDLLKQAHAVGPVTGGKIIFDI